MRNTPHQKKMMAYGLFGAVVLAASSLWAQESSIKPIPADVKVNQEKAALGEKLYHDPILSADGKISCATCHQLHKGGTDRLPVSNGIKGQRGPINSPTVFNSAHNFVQFWDGRAKDLKAQALGPVENPLEMGEKWPQVLDKLQEHKEYGAALSKLYGKGFKKEDVADAIAEFERTLTTPDSRFDLFLKGKKDALTALEKQGYELFQKKNCTLCHSGTYLGGESYQMLNPEYFTARGGKLTDADMGRYNVTKKEEDRHMFKVPMLRNVAVTAPYFHDGRVRTLEEAIRLMGKYQLGEEIPAQEVRAIAAFLKTLTGTYQGVPLDKVKPRK
jgi:cytochrome c peroxidase